MSKLIAVRIPDELYNKVESSLYKTKSECIIDALQKLFDKSSEVHPIIYEENQETVDKLYKIIDDYSSQLIKKDEQLKVKDQQIFSLIAVQKDLTEKTTEQVKLLGDQMKSKKWYHFWK